MRVLALVLAVCSLLAGCVTQPKQQHNQVDQFEAFTAVNVEQGALRLRTGDIFSMSVELGGETEVEAEELRIQYSGKAVVPVLGAVSLSNLTLDEATDKLTESYREFYVQEPIVRLQLSADQEEGTFPWGSVTVLGRVTKPGQIAMPATRVLRVSGAIQAAEGFDTSANLRALRITRRGPDGEKLQLTIDMKQLGEGGDATQDIRLRDGDVVFVPERIF